MVLFAITRVGVSLVFAVSPSPGAGVVISLSEVVACEENEWVEIFNSSSDPVDLTGWKIEKQGKDSLTSSAKTLSPQSATISAHQYSRTEVGSSFLSNAGFTLRLKDASGVVLEENIFPACPSGNLVTSWIKQGMIWSLTTHQTPDAENILVIPGTPTPTPTAIPTTSPTQGPTSTPIPTIPTTAKPTASPTPSPGPQPEDITISEVLACQGEGETEWIELYNQNERSVTLTNWKLLDDDNNVQDISSLSLDGHGYGVVEVTAYKKGMLTNSGDILTLKDAASKKVDSFSFTSCDKGSSFSKVAGVWQELSTITKGKANPQPKADLPQAGTATPIPEGDGGDISAKNSDQEESSASGYVLGTQTQAVNESGTQSPQSTLSPGPQDQNWVALSSIGAGIVILTATAGYFGYQKWKHLSVGGHPS